MIIIVLALLHLIVVS